MSMKVRSNYINPLTMMDKKNTQRPGQSGISRRDTVSELQTKQQQLQNQMLLLKATGTDAGADPDAQKALEAELQKVSAELRTAKADPSQTVEQTDKTQSIHARRSQDCYESEETQTAAPGIYQVDKDPEQGYKISFLPYSE